jgi:hypothetical protein
VRLQSCGLQSEEDMERMARQGTEKGGILGQVLWLYAQLQELRQGAPAPSASKLK